MGSEHGQKDPIFDEKRAEQRQVPTRDWKAPVLRELDIRDTRIGPSTNVDATTTNS